MPSTQRSRGGTRGTEGRGRRSRRARVTRMLAVCLVAMTGLVADLSAPPVAGAATEHHREVVSGASAVAGSSFSLTVPDGVTTVAGRHLVVTYLFSDNTAQVTSIVDTHGNTYRVDVAVSNAGSSGLRLAVAAVGFGDTSATLASGNGFADVVSVSAERNNKRKTVALATKDLTSAESVAYSGVLSTRMQSVSAVVTYRTVEASPPPGPPTASFTAAPTSGPAPLAVQFTDTSSGAPTQWVWGFGDGATSVEPNPAHTYTRAGTYTVGLTVTNAGGSNTATQVGVV